MIFLSYSTLVQKNISNIQKLVSLYEILSIDEVTAIAYGNIKAAQRKKGKPIPENDIWIAAIAQHHKLSLVTRDNHFIEVENISLRKW